MKSTKFRSAHESHQRNSEPHREPRVRPNKMARSSSRPATIGTAPVQRKSSGTMPNVPIRSASDWTNDPSMDAAHRPWVDTGRQPSAVAKCVDGSGGTRIGLVVERQLEGNNAVQKAGEQESGAKTPKPKKKAGVDSFTVNWSRSANASDTNARLRLDYRAKFKDDDQHDPALAEFRQNVMTVAKITDGPNKGFNVNTGPMHDDNYSRADDVGGNTINDVDFVSNDNPGLSPIDADDELDYAFTAEQLIIDTSDGNKVIARQGPHTGTITGKHPRHYNP